MKKARITVPCLYLGPGNKVFRGTVFDFPFDPVIQKEIDERAGTVEVFEVHDPVKELPVHTVEDVILEDFKEETVRPVSKRMARKIAKEDSGDDE